MKFWHMPKHLGILNDEVGELRDLYVVVCERVAKVETNVEWIKWLVILILGGVISLVIKAYVLP